MLPVEIPGNRAVHGDAHLDTLASMITAEQQPAQTGALPCRNEPEEKTDGQKKSDTSSSYKKYYIATGIVGVLVAIIKAITGDTSCSATGGSCVSASDCCGTDSFCSLSTCS